MPVSNTVFLNDAAYASASYTSGWLNYESTSYFTFTAYCDAGVDLTLDYAIDASYQILETETIPVSAVTTVTVTRPVKTSYIRFSVINIPPPVDLKLQGFFFTTDMGVSALENVGSGAQIFKPPHDMRTLISSDASVTVTQNATEIDLTGAGSVLTTDSTEDLQVTYPTATSTLITVGNKHGGTDYSQSLYIDQEDPRPADSAITNSVFLGNRAGAGDGGTSTRYSDSVCVGSKSVVGGGEAVCIGARMTSNSSSSNSVTIGTFAKASNSGVTIGRSAIPFDGSTIRNVCIGAQTRADSYGVSVGYNAGAGGTARNYAICIGNSCSQPGANGRLAFGSNMEGVQTTATAGAQTLPANPAGFLRLEWNGTLYKIPVYND